jgi:hypothetical protein
MVQVLPKMSSELQTSVRNNGARNFMKSDYLIEIQLSIVGWTIVYLDRNEVSQFG